MAVPPIVIPGLIGPPGVPPTVTVVPPPMLTKEVVFSFEPSAVFDVPRFPEHSPHAVNSMAFSPEGDLLVTASDNGLLSLVNVDTGRLDSFFRCDEVGACCVTFTRHNSSVLHGATTIVPDKSGACAEVVGGSGTAARCARLDATRILRLRFPPLAASARAPQA